MKAIRIEKAWKDGEALFFQVAVGDDADMPKRGKEVLEFSSQEQLDALIQQERNPTIPQLLARAIADDAVFDITRLDGRSVNRKFEAVAVDVIDG